MMNMIFLILFTTKVFASSGLTDDIASIAKAGDPRNITCGRLRILGPCMMGGLEGVKINYMEPELVIKTFLKSNGTNTVSGDILKFYEVHIYDHPLKIAEEIALCPDVPNMTLGVRYLSEVDKEQWHKESSETRVDIGQWGSIFPISGFIFQVNPARGSALEEQYAALEQPAPTPPSTNTAVLGATLCPRSPVKMPST